MLRRTWWPCRHSGATPPPRGRVVAGVRSTFDVHEFPLAGCLGGGRTARVLLLVTWQLADPPVDRIEARTHAKDWAQNGNEVLAVVTAA